MKKVKQMYRIVWKSKKSKKAGAGPWSTGRAGLVEMTKSLNRTFPYRHYEIEGEDYDENKIY
ncbi:MAG: hypothetical protein KAS66_00185 [Candidatus Omnitrophica bacterium]|nr:hypothetical protein [Candidatus Omnitrophota bacterium]